MMFDETATPSSLMPHEPNGSILSGFQDYLSPSHDTAGVWFSLIHLDKFSSSLGHLHLPTWSVHLIFGRALILSIDTFLLVSHQFFIDPNFCTVVELLVFSR